MGGGMKRKYPLMFAALFLARRGWCVLLIRAARPTSPASDQTTGGVGRVYREHRGPVPRSKGSI